MREPPGRRSRGTWQRSIQVRCGRSHSAVRPRTGRLSSAAIEVVSSRAGGVGSPRGSVPGTVNFGDTCLRDQRQATLNVCNTGKADLVIDPIASSNSQFIVTTPSAGYPVVISPD